MLALGKGSEESSRPCFEQDFISAGGKERGSGKQILELGKGHIVWRILDDLENIGSGYVAGLFDRAGNRHLDFHEIIALIGDFAV